MREYSYNLNLYFIAFKIPNNFLNCVLDEVHVHSIARPGSWIATEYINQHDPCSFIEFGGEETGP